MDIISSCQSAVCSRTCVVSCKQCYSNLSDFTIFTINNQYWQLIDDRVVTLQVSSNYLTFPGISHRGINIHYITRGIQTGLHVLLSEYCGTTGSPSCACQLYLTVLRLCLFCDYCNCITCYGQTHISPTFRNFPDFYLTNVKFPNFSRFCRWGATLKQAN